jgi:hypothetical protein
MTYFFSIIIGVVILGLALKSGRDNGYPYLGSIDEDEANDND